MVEIIKSVRVEQIPNSKHIRRFAALLFCQILGSKGEKDSQIFLRLKINVFFTGFVPLKAFMAVGF